MWPCEPKRNVRFDLTFIAIIWLRVKLGSQNYSQRSKNDKQLYKLYSGLQQKSLGTMERKKLCKISALVNYSDASIIRSFGTDCFRCVSLSITPSPLPSMDTIGVRPGATLEETVTDWAVEECSVPFSVVTETEVVPLLDVGSAVAATMVTFCSLGASVVSLPLALGSPVTVVSLLPGIEVESSVTLMVDDRFGVIRSVGLMVVADDKVGVGVEVVFPLSLCVSVLLRRGASVVISSVTLTVIVLGEADVVVSPVTAESLAISTDELVTSVKLTGDEVVD